MKDAEPDETDGVDTLKGHPLLSASDRMHDLSHRREGDFVSNDEFEEQSKRLIAQV